LLRRPEYLVLVVELRHHHIRVSKTALLQFCEYSLKQLSHNKLDVDIPDGTLECGFQPPGHSRCCFTGTTRLFTLETMWNVEERFEKKQMDSLASLGFSVGSTRGVVRVEKYGSGAEFRQNPDGRFQMTILPTIMLKGQFTRLWDAGYQKFLLTDDGTKLPALAAQLANLRKFNEELRTALGVPTFYNEALGSVSALSVYDRVKGRPGDIPDKTVGAHEPSREH
jgi:hypothetical protein